MKGNSCAQPKIKNTVASFHYFILPERRERTQGGEGQVLRREVFLRKYALLEDRRVKKLDGNEQ